MGAGPALELPPAAASTAGLKLDSPLLRIQSVAMSSKTEMAIVGIGPDRVIKRYTLHKDSAGWDYFFMLSPHNTAPGPQKVLHCQDGLCISQGALM